MYIFHTCKEHTIVYMYLYIEKIVGFVFTHSAAGVIKMYVF